MCTVDRRQSLTTINAHYKFQSQVRVDWVGSWALLGHVQTFHPNRPNPNPTHTPTPNPKFWVKFFCVSGKLCMVVLDAGHHRPSPCQVSLHWRKVSSTYTLSRKLKAVERSSCGCEQLTVGSHYQRTMLTTTSNDKFELTGLVRWRCWVMSKLFFPLS